MKDKAKVKNIIAYAVVAAGMAAAAFVMPSGAGESFIGAWNMMPLVVIFAFIVLTGKVLAGFFWCSLLTSIMYYGITASPAGFVESIFGVVTDYDNWWVIYLFLIGGVLTGIFTRSGAAGCMIDWLSKRVKSRKGIMYVLSLISVPFATNDYMTIMLSGNIFAGLLEKKRVPREMTAYIIRCSATSASVLLPFGAWTIFFAKQCEKYIDIPAGINGMGWFMGNVLPYLFFPMAAFVVCWLAIAGVIPPLGRMKAGYEALNERREEGESGPEASDGKTPRNGVNISHFLVPIALVIIFGIIYDWEMSYALTWAVLLSFGYFILTKVFSAGECMEVIVDGFASMADMSILMGLALVVIYNLSRMGFVEYLVSLIGGGVSASMLPLAIFVLFSVTEFLATFDYTLFMLATPVIARIAVATGANAGLCLAAMVSASIFGFEASFSSEGGVLACASCGRLDPYEQTVSQLPYGIIAWILSLAAYVIAGLA